MIKSHSKRKKSHMFGAVSLLLSTVIFASCVPVSPLSFPLANGPTPPAGAPVTAPRTTAVAAGANAAPINAATPVATPTAEPAAGSPESVARTAGPATGLGGMASAAIAEATPSPNGPEESPDSAPTPKATTTSAVPRPVPPINPVTLAAALDCLEQGDVVYALALQNTNVRQDASTTACRIGRIPRGTLVRITDMASLPGADAAPAPAAAPATPSSQAPAVGYIEDVLPVLQRNCNTCHSGVAKIQELQVTSYEGIMKGSVHGPVVLPGDSTGSLLWQLVSTGKMPVIGTLSNGEKSLIKQWIDGGAPENRPALAAAAPVRTPNAQDTVWLNIEPADINPVGDACAAPLVNPQHAVSSQLMLPVVCGEEPAAVAVDLLRAKMGLPTASNSSGLPPVSAGADVSATLAATATNTLTDSAAGTAATESAETGEQTATISATAAITQSAAPIAPLQSAFASAAAEGTGITASALGLPTPTDDDPWLTPRGGLCVERKLPNNDRGITAITFAPDGRMFLAFDSKLTGQDVDQIILYDAFHPSRSIGVIDSAAMQGLTEIMQESSRITGMDWQDGVLYISRAGEVGRIADGGVYETLAGGFAVNSQLFHANNGLVIANGWLYVSAGGVRDGYSDGPIVDIAEDAAQAIVSGGNGYAARIVRAPLDVLTSQRAIGAFSTAARGARNPYGITADAAGRIWFTDNGATNVPDDVSAGDEVNILNPGAIGGDEASTPYYGFPLAITQPQPWYSAPAVVLPNTAAPTGITWALGTIYYAQYGKDPGLYRLGVGADGKLVSERVMLGWPILALATAPDGALWVGMGDGSLLRMTSGCQ
jgi:glucose/arabinose dehydrogenase